jgi:cyclin L
MASSLLSNPLATPEQLAGRIRLSGLPPELLDSVFIATQMLTQAAGLLLEQPQSVTAQANVLIARYWLVESPLEHEFCVSDAIFFPAPISGHLVANLIC